MKTTDETPNDVIAGFADAQYCRWDAQDVLDALDDAGYQIVEKMPPNTVMIVTTDEQGCIVRFEQKGETFSLDPAKP